jgi:hypothetical protein
MPRDWCALAVREQWSLNHRLAMTGRHVEIVSKHTAA